MSFLGQFYQENLLVLSEKTHVKFDALSRQNSPNIFSPKRGAQ